MAATKTADDTTRGPLSTVRRTGLRRRPVPASRQPRRGGGCARRDRHAHVHRREQRHFDYTVNGIPQTKAITREVFGPPADMHVRRAPRYRAGDQLPGPVVGGARGIGSRVGHQSHAPGRHDLCQPGLPSTATTRRCGWWCRRQKTAPGTYSGRWSRDGTAVQCDAVSAGWQPRGRDRDARRHGDVHLHRRQQRDVPLHGPACRIPVPQTKTITREIFARARHRVPTLHAPARLRQREPDRQSHFLCRHALHGGRRSSASGRRRRHGARRRQLPGRVQEWSARPFVRRDLPDLSGSTYARRHAGQRHGARSRFDHLQFRFGIRIGRELVDRQVSSHLDGLRSGRQPAGCIDLEYAGRCRLDQSGEATFQRAVAAVNLATGNLA